ncbi:FadR/GntR family transcriptional regulator [Cereibacter johrii]|uniref:GntR family transcriptional regulator n=1 Tax=Cereibacter johrii TaxID=445629 RepID=A0ABX5J2N3_9RHOB|nr:FadR/GntR family transcriptional regulator [Cereibacter johrii]ODM43113.1 GntR family transcriptional regulator [Cereibacter johrii]PTM75847.1 GntR family transcriptional regulator [Cereibacter johrii]
MRKRRDSLASVVARDLAERIERGDYAVGDKIPIEAQLCEMYNVSRTVVREAIATLRSEGLVTSRHGVGVFVEERGNPALSITKEAAGELSEVLELLELRLGVEVEAAGLAARRATAEDLRQIREVLEKTSDLDAFGEHRRELDYAFHLAIARASGNSWMPKFMDFIGPVIIPRSQLLHDPQSGITRDYLRQMVEEHRQIVEAIAAGDAAAAQEAMRMHLSTSLERYRRRLTDA